MNLTSYEPTSLKSLFNKSLVNTIKSWLSKTDHSSPSGLLLYGPIGCGKSATLRVLLKPYRTIHINADNIRTSVTSADIINTLQFTSGNSSFDSSSSGKLTIGSTLQNIIVIDNIELIDKQIKPFITALFDANVCIPVICISNTKKHIGMFRSLDHFSTVELPQPSLLDTFKLVDTINKGEHLELNSDQINNIIQVSFSDLRQIYSILGSWKISKILKCSFDTFILKISEKDKDEDLSTKLHHLFDYSKPYSFEKTFLSGSSEPSAISYSFFKNYLMSSNINLDLITQFSSQLSLSNVFAKDVFEDYDWQILDFYVVSAINSPSFLVKSNKVDFPFTLVTDDKDSNTDDVIIKRNISNLRKELLDANCNKLATLLSDHSSLFYISEMCKVMLGINSSNCNKKTKGKQKSSSQATQSPQISNIIQFILSYDLYKIDSDKPKSSHSKFDISIYKKLISCLGVGKIDFKKNNLEQSICKELLQAIPYIDHKPNISFDVQEVNLSDIWNLKSS